MGITKSTFTINPTPYESSGTVYNAGTYTVKVMVETFVANSNGEWAIDEVITDTTSPTDRMGSYEVVLKNTIHPRIKLRFTHQNSVSLSPGVYLYETINGNRCLIEGGNSGSYNMGGPFRSSDTASSAVFTYVSANESSYGILKSTYGTLGTRYGFWFGVVSNGQAKKICGRVNTSGGNPGWYYLPKTYSIAGSAAVNLNTNNWSRAVGQTASMVQTVFTEATSGDSPFWFDGFCGTKLWKSSYSVVDGTIYTIDSKKYFAIEPTQLLELT